VFASAGLAILVAAATWLIAAAAAPEYPYGDLPFFVLTGLIIAGSFSLIAWAWTVSMTTVELFVMPKQLSAKERDRWLGHCGWCNRERN
jgi:hypothetical protein